MHLGPPAKASAQNDRASPAGPQAAGPAREGGRVPPARAGEARDSQRWIPVRPQPTRGAARHHAQAASPPPWHTWMPAPYPSAATSGTLSSARSREYPARTCSIVSRACAGVTEITPFLTPCGGERAPPPPHPAPPPE